MFLRYLQGAQMHLVGRVFETPVLRYRLLTDGPCTHNKIRVWVLLGEEGRKSKIRIFAQIIYLVKEPFRDFGST